MSDSDADTTKGAGRRAKVFLSPSRKYDIYVQLMRGQTTVGAAAAQARVDRSTIMRLQQVARQGALQALAASRPGASGKPARDVKLDQARAEIDRLTRTVTEQAAGLVVPEKKKGAWPDAHRTGSRTGGRSHQARFTRPGRLRRRPGLALIQDLCGPRAVQQTPPALETPPGQWEQPG